MARLLEHFTSEARECAYLPAKSASLEYKIMLGVGREDLEHLLERGWRRFGPAYFRPACAGCRECVPLRIPVRHFELSRNLRRVLSKAEGLEVQLATPTIDADRLDLYRLWHGGRAERRQWGDNEMDAERYFHEFAFPHPSVRELSFWDPTAPEGRRLVAVSIVDETPRSLSAVYTYHHPAYARMSLGTLSILQQVELARRNGKSWVYLGYRVSGCPSSEYKARFRPHELLDGWPENDETPVWRLVK